MVATVRPPPFLDIPKVKPFPREAVQCDACGGNGCMICDDRGWLLPKDHQHGRRCLREACRKPLRPDWIAVYCSNECAALDA